jgi:SAM-dependent methyltransferase
MYNSLVKPDSAETLLRLNRQFYQTFALQFSATRMQLQPGVRRVLESLPAEANILDLGCGNGELARELDRRGHRGAYIGLDLSSALLKEAERTPLESLKATFVQADLADPRWARDIQWLQASTTKFGLDVILAFAVLHHVPGEDLHLQTLQRVRECLAPGGRFIHSEWQFLNSPRLRERIQPWELIGLSPGDMDPGDYLLDWRSGGTGLRYVHHFSEDELARLAQVSHFEVIETFYSDGEGGKLGLYQVWMAK